MNRIGFVLAAILFFSATGCSENQLVSPATGVLSDQQAQVVASAYNEWLWGYWDISIDIQSGKIEATPMRGACFTANVVKFIDGPPVNLLLELVKVEAVPAYTDITVNVGLKHPFPGLNAYKGFDVIGVFMGNASDSHPGPDGLAIAGENDQRLLNEDGYTRWFNAPEFTGAGQQMPLFGYFPGKLGTKDYVPNACLNPYKYFADGLDKNGDAFEFLSANPDTRGAFSPGNVNYRRYELRFPASTGVRFQYAVAAHWKPNIKHPAPPDSLDDFPPSANADEALVISVVDSSDLYYIDSSTFGGNVALNISPVDWFATCSGAMEEYSIVCCSSAWTGPAYANMVPVAQGQNYFTYKFEKSAELLNSNEPVTVWIEVVYPELDYSNDYGILNSANGVLKSHFRVEIPVSNQPPLDKWIHVTVPAGGEEWAVGTIQGIIWESMYVTGTVFIEYSRDNFTADINTIATNEPNDGSYMWHVPNTKSTTVKVRVSSTADPSVFGVSGQFAIVDAGWARTFGGPDWDTGWKSAVDHIGNIYVTGSFEGSVDFNPEVPDTDPKNVDLHSTKGVIDAFIIKFDHAGKFQWAHTWGGTSNDTGFGIAVDSQNNVYVSGFFRGAIDVDPDPNNVVTLTSVGNSDDAFLLKFDTDGKLIYAKSIGSAGSECARGVGVDSADNVYVAGHFQNTIEFGPGQPCTSFGSLDPFIAKYDSSGVNQWARSWGGTAMDFTMGAVAFDDSDNVYVAGCFEGTANFDPWGSGNIKTSNGLRDIFVSSFNSSGTYRWAQVWGSTQNDEGHSLAANSSGVYVTGRVQGSLDFNPNGGAPYTMAGLTDAFVSKFSKDGVFQWVRAWGSLGTAVDGWDIATDPFGYVYVTGYFYSTVNFNPWTGPDILTVNGGCDAFISKFNSDGVYQWARKIGGTGYDSGYGIICDEYGRFYLTGYFRSPTLNFHPAGTDIHANYDSSSNSADVFIVKYLANGLWGE